MLSRWKVTIQPVQQLVELRIIDNKVMECFQWRTQEFCSGGGFQQIQLRTEDRENGDLGAVAPSQEFWRQL